MRKIFSEAAEATSNEFSFVSKTFKPLTGVAFTYVSLEILAKFSICVSFPTVTFHLFQIIFEGHMFLFDAIFFDTGVLYLFALSIFFRYISVFAIFKQENNCSCVDRFFRVFCAIIVVNCSHVSNSSGTIMKIRHSNLRRHGMLGQNRTMTSRKVISRDGGITDFRISDNFSMTEIFFKIGRFSNR